MILVQRSIKDKSDFVEWSISGSPQEDKNGWYVRIGSWTANFWFHVSIGKTVKQTLGNAKRRLPSLTGEQSTYEYVETEPDYSEQQLIKFLRGRKVKNMIDKIIAYEQGELNDEETIDLFQGLIDTGEAWTLQGSYDRMAKALIEAGHCHK